MSRTKMKRGSLQEKLCRRFCRYYKPEKDETLACMGYLVLEGLSAGGSELPFPEPGERASADVERVLTGLMCTRCPFYEDGCDFAAGEAGSSPCGGFIVLGRMREGRAVSLKDIDDAIKLIK